MKTNILFTLSKAALSILAVRVRTLLLFLLPALLLSSCLKDQEDFFEDSASARLSKYQQEIRQTLMSAPYGWLFEIYPGSTQSHGGYAFTCKFDSLTVEVKSELDTTMTCTSYYKITSETAASLTFDTYNELMHYFAEGTSSLYQGFGGDVEYVIDSISSDLVKVHGARSLSTYYLRRLDRPAEQYLREQAAFVKKYNDDSFTMMSGTINGIAVSGEVTPSSLYMNVTVADSIDSDLPIVFTSTGLRFYSPLQVGDATVSEMTYDFAARAYTGVDSKGQSFSLAASYPEWVIRYNEWAGDYKLGYKTKEDGETKYIDVTLTPTDDKSAYTMSGLAKAFDVELNYMKATNKLELRTQYVGSALSNKNIVRLVVWDSNTGYITWSEGVGFTTKWNEANQNYDLVDNAVWKSYTVRGFILYEYTTSGTRVGSLATTYTDYMINGANRLPYVVSLTKKN